MIVVVIIAIWTPKRNPPKISGLQRDSNPWHCSANAEEVLEFFSGYFAIAEIAITTATIISSHNKSSQSSLSIKLSLDFKPTST